MVIEGMDLIDEILACVASFSIWFRAKKDREKGLWFWPRKKWKENQEMKEGEGEGKEGNACLAWLREKYWHVSMKGMFHTERSCMVHDTHLNFLWLLFILVGKIHPPRQEHFFNFFWKGKLFLRLYEGFRLFNLFSKVSPGSEWLKAIFFCQGMRWFPAMFSHAWPSSLVFFFLTGC